MSDRLAEDCARYELRPSVNELLITCQGAENLTVYTRHRFPAKVIRHCVWLFSASVSAIAMSKQLMAGRGVMIA
jgi:hypothetical protein